MTYKPFGGKTYFLNSSISSTATEIVLASFTVPVSGVPITMALLGTDIVYGTISPKTGSSEFISFTGITQNANGTATLTGVTRGLAKLDPFTGSATYRLPHSGQTQFIISNPPQHYNKYMTLENDETVLGTKTFTSTEIPIYDVHPTFTDDKQLIDKKYVDDIAIAGAPDASTTTKGIGKTSVAPASPTNPIFVGDNDGRVPTQDENDALVGTSGIPSASNPYVTEDDTASSATADKVARRNATGDVTVPATPTGATDASSKAYVDSLSSAIDTTSYVLGESFTGATTPQPATIINDLHQWGMGGGGTSPLNWTNVLSYSFGHTTYEQKALKIIPRGNVTIASVILQLGKVGTPVDNAFIEIQPDSAGSPSGTPVSNGTSSTVAGSALSSTAYQEHTLTFATPPALTSGTTYWVVFKRSSSLSGSDYYLTAVLENSLKYGSFDGKHYTNSAWVSGTLPSLQLIPATGSSLSLWKTDSDNSCWLINQFFGWCITTDSAGAAATLVKSGVLGGFTGLNIGVDYYTSTTAGSYTNTGGGIYVGRALSATQIEVPKVKYGSPINTGLFSGIGTTGGGISQSCPRYKLPYNGIFMVVSTAGGSNLSGIVYLDNDYNTRTSRYLLGDSADPSSTTDTLAYTRGQYISFALSTTNPNWTIRFNPVLE